MDPSHVPLNLADVQIFGPNSAAAGIGFVTWVRPRRATMLAIICHAGGGGGGNGTVDVNSAAGGGGGGGSSGQTTFVGSALLLPSTLFVSVGIGGAIAGTGVASRVSIYPDTTANNCLITANGGGAGGNASGVGGSAGGAGAIATIATMPLAGCGAFTLLAGQAGIIGGAAVGGAALTLPVTGLWVTGGSGGGGLPAGGAGGTAGGSFTVAGIFPAHIGGIGGSTATTPPKNGSNGMDRAFTDLFYSYGGTGGGSSHGSASGAGLHGGNGGTGGPGSGAGGGGGALTGSTTGNGGLGGPGRVIMIAW